jgi:hypothetical protein
MRKKYYALFVFVGLGLVVGFSHRIYADEYSNYVDGIKDQCKQTVIWYPDNHPHGTTSSLPNSNRCIAKEIIIIRDVGLIPATATGVLKKTHKRI